METRGDREGHLARGLRGEVGPLLEQFEQTRKAAVRKGLTQLGWCSIGTVAAFALLVRFFGMHDFMLLPLFAGLGYAGYLWNKATRSYVVGFKHQVVRRIIALVDPGLEYRPADRIHQNEFKASGLFRQAIDRYSGEDYVAGKVGATALRFSEVHAEYKTETTSNGKRRTSWHTIFKGLYFVADFNKHFNGRTVVMPDALQGLFGGLAQMLQKLNFRKEELVKLEDPDFEKAFVVYGTDQVEARYILSPSLMRRILDFRAKMGEDVYFSFSGQCVYVAVKTSKNRFEPRLFKSLLEAGFAEGLLEEVRLAVGVVEDLNLNTRIWTKA